MLDPLLTKQHFSTKIYRCYFHFLEHEYPQVDVRQLCLDCGLPYDYLVDENNWVSVTFDERFTRLCIERTGDQELCYKVGKLGATEVGLGQIMYLLIKFSVSLDFLYSQIPRVAGYVSRVTAFDLVYSIPGMVVLRISARTPELLLPEERAALRANFENIFQNSIGHLGALPVLHGASNATITHTDLSGPDDSGFPTYEFKIKYETHKNLKAILRENSLVLLSISASTLVGLGLRFGLRIDTAACLSLSVSVFFLAIALRSKTKLALLTNSLSWVANDYDLLDKRYEALQLANEKVQSISEVNSRYRRIVEEMQLGLIVLTRNPQNKSWYPSALSNSAFQRLAEKACGPDGVTGLVQGLIARYSEELEMVVSVRRSLFLERLEFGPDGPQKTYLSLRCVPVDGKMIALILDDTTEQVSAEMALELERLRSAQSAKLAALGEMAAGISHELNNPLAIISGSSQQISEACDQEPFDRERVRRSAQRVAATVTRMVKIIGGIRAFSRDASHDPMKVHALSDIIAATLDLCEKRFTNHGVQLKLHGCREGQHILCRDVEISQVLLNLLNNAFDAVMEVSEKEIIIEVEETVSLYRLAIEDSGPGIPTLLREKIFQPFFTTKEVGKGTGLGLSIAKGIMEKHGGSLSIDENSGRTRFILTFSKSISRPDAQAA